MHCEKIGSSNYFWSFPSETTVKLETEASKLQSRMKERQSEETQLRRDVQVSMKGKEENTDRQNLARQMSLLEEEIASKREEVDAHAANDPERYEALRKS